MWKYVLKRIGLAFITACIILTITFILMKLLPFAKPLGTNDQQFSYYMKEVNLGFVLDLPEKNEELGDYLWYFKDASRTEHYFYQTPVFDQYFSWIKNIVTKWDWGQSTYILPNNSAGQIIANRLPTSMSLNIISVLFSVPLGILLGIIAALKKNTKTDHIISTSIMVFISIPSFVLITFLMLIFCYKLGWLPTQWPASTAPQADKIKGFILPVICLSFGSICGYARFTRAELCEVMESDYLLLARTKGLTRRQATVRHAMRNAMVPIFPMILGEFISVLSGSLIIEEMFAIPGVGRLYVNSVQARPVDYNFFMLLTVFYTLIGLTAGIIIDISYGIIDPRIRMGAK